LFVYKVALSVDLLLKRYQLLRILI
jgi:hypothetical protein